MCNIDLWKPESEQKGPAGQILFQRFNLRKGTMILNVGCDIDPWKLRRDFDAINVDVNEWSGANNMPTAADRIHDCRIPFPMLLHGRFDSVVLGDILEHFTDEDIAATLANCHEVLKEGGQVVITVPDDHRPMEKQRMEGWHTEGVPKHHPRPITIDMLTGWVTVAGFAVASVQQRDYGFCAGWGVTATKTGAT